MTFLKIDFVRLPVNTRAPVNKVCIRVGDHLTLRNRKQCRIIIAIPPIACIPLHYHTLFVRDSSVYIFNISYR